MRRLLREPLLHFAMIGALLFGLHSWKGGPAADVEPVRIGAPELNWLEQTWTRQWRRPPTEQEARGLVVELLREELLSREARALGLDRDDTVVRRRLAQKVEFLMQDTARLGEPSEQILRAYYQVHAGDFVSPARFSFQQILFSSTHRGDSGADARRELAALESNPARDVAGEGDASLLPTSVENLEATGIAGQFGDAFARAVAAAPDGKWQGPVESPFGAHLLRVLERQPSRQRSYEEVVDQVGAAWRADREAEISAGYFDELLKRYPVAVDEQTAALVAGIDGVRLQTASRELEQASR